MVTGRFSPVGVLAILFLSILFLSVQKTIADSVPGEVSGSLKISDTEGGFTGTLDDGDRFGASLAPLGCLNSDSLSTLAVGTPYDDDGGTDRGAVRILFLDSTGAVISFVKISDTSGGFTGTLEDGELFGWSVASLGDLDDDSHTDLAVGAPLNDEGSWGWPADTGAEIGQMGDAGHIPDDYEPSGAVWQTRLSRLLLVSDSGLVSETDEDGGNATTWDVGGDLEGITVADPESDLVYLGCENPDGVREFDLSTGALTGNSWDLTPWMTGPGNQGLEALTYVDGLFYAGLQNDGNIFVFDLLPGGSVQYIRMIPSPGGRAQISGMHYDSESGVLYAVYDPYNEILEMTADGELLREYPLAGDNQEGIAVVPECASATATLFIAEDDGDVMRYGGYPVSCGSPGLFPGEGVLWVFFPDSAGTVQSFTRIGEGEGGFGGALGDGDFFGASVVSLGDMDGDGVLDLAVGASYDDDGGTLPFSRRGAVWILYMETDGTVKAEQKISGVTGGFSGVLNDGDFFGHALASPGDLDDDGIADLVVGAPYDDDGGPNRGALWVLFLNGDGTVRSHAKISSTEGGFTGSLDDDDNFGSSVVSLGDVDGDCIGDLAVGSVHATGGGNECGAISVLMMNTDGSVRSHVRITDTEGGFDGTLDDGDDFGFSLASPWTGSEDSPVTLAAGAPGDDDGGPGRGAVWMLTLNDLNATGIAGSGAVPAIPPSSSCLRHQPNPFNPAGTIRFFLDRGEGVKVSVLNTRGRIERDLLDMEMTSGWHSIRWNGTDNSGRSLPSGVYFCLLETATGSTARKIVLIR